MTPSVLLSFTPQTERESQLFRLLEGALQLLAEYEQAATGPGSELVREQQKTINELLTKVGTATDEVTRRGVCMQLIERATTLDEAKRIARAGIESRGPWPDVAVDGRKR